MKQIAKYMNAYVEKKQLQELEGMVETAVSGVKFYRSSQAAKRIPLMYQSGIILMGQGYKNIYLGEHKMSYGPGDYVVLGVPLPLECDTKVEDGKPILGITIDVLPKMLHSVINHIQQHEAVSGSGKNSELLGVQCVCLSDPLEEAFLRLIKALGNDAEAEFLGESIVREIVYRVVKGPMGHILYERANVDGNYAKVAKALDIVHSHFADSITVENLADEIHMSIPAFHRAFKQVTAESPLQYLKKVRLTKARELIIAEGLRAADAARKVGYNSPSQFSREFKRHFSYSPKESFARAS
ncbi:AraC family transcriptional regulator [Vibrio sp. JC009]|uniref:AraC family transcriptional regulator n=1 Tax=Vibrio sp. JC009 TaxID=2912314 RepID=UPI0023B1340F|nr:AraC family transcriptional regulator [Vibrio sp. JC009]WED23625.1 AraC family transcriptional regulator [Vibrio sp. JC009]